MGMSVRTLRQEKARYENILEQHKAECEEINKQIAWKREVFYQMGSREAAEYIIDEMVKPLEGIE